MCVKPSNGTTLWDVPLDGIDGLPKKSYGDFTSKTVSNHGRTMVHLIMIIKSLRTAIECKCTKTRLILNLKLQYRKTVKSGTQILESGTVIERMASFVLSNTIVKTPLYWMIKKKCISESLSTVRNPNKRIERTWIWNNPHF